MSSGLKPAEETTVEANANPYENLQSSSLSKPDQSTTTHQEDKLLSDLATNPETEIITSNHFDMRSLFQEGGPKRIRYMMEFVPLKLGVKVNADPRHYTDEAVQHYKKRAMDLMQETLMQNY